VRRRRPRHGDDRRAPGLEGVEDRPSYLALTADLVLRVALRGRASSTLLEKTLRAALQPCRSERLFTTRTGSVVRRFLLDVRVDGAVRATGFDLRSMVRVHERLLDAGRILYVDGPLVVRSGHGCDVHDGVRPGAAGEECSALRRRHGVGRDVGRRSRYGRDRRRRWGARRRRRRCEGRGDGGASPSCCRGGRSGRRRRARRRHGGR